MLEHVPSWLGRLLRDVRAGHGQITAADNDLAVDAADIVLRSSAFSDGGRLPPRFTADGEGVSPPLHWSGLPEGTAAVALIVEDPDAPAPNPLVHALVWNIPADCDGLAEGEIRPDAGGADDGSDVGRNSYLQEGWLPPDPPTGHGSHDYVFQLFALAKQVDLSESPGRSAMVRAMAGNVLGLGLLVGTYSRGEEAMVGPEGSTLRAV